MALIGYARVSTLKQDLNEQIVELEKFGCTKIFSGKHSGKAEKNEEPLNELLNYIREGDTVVVTKLDRLGRSLSQCLKVLDILTVNKIGFIALNQGIDTTKRKDPMAMAMIHLLGLFAELERNFIVERTQGGKLAKIESGDLKAIGGRPKTLSEKDEKRLLKDIQKSYSLTKLAEKYEVSRATISRYKKIAKSKKAIK
ncbi:recombinase family protein [Glaesserella parasuis]|uniref:recombinase family protein n=1 Tax=Glaesserella parasuis TaxID=738 RepID=UPI00094FF160|nr:recombinase family protein [Glaesserella parasuis]MCT8756572.1 recombinase family protein [Glaesserella parasuis]MCT8760461.1 recombinase family protein [Glaesserella parasuis]MCT8766601.1 recombinase family protein [Glaesserella parasuis]MDD2170387.1 recombinase family protein [Glaesserella parasuis]MDG6280396.1 recombinase family protein [Glaesserella parasuis]